MSKISQNKSKGFTIVELLIVIIVIAILAAISIVAYSAIRQRADNTAVVDTAAKIVRAVGAYIASNEKYPIVSNGTMCVTTLTGCRNAASSIASNSTFDAAIDIVAVLPRSVPKSGSDRYGIIYYQSSGMLHEGSPAPAHLEYYLQGLNQQCGLGNVKTNLDTNSVTSTTGYTEGDTGGGKTRCKIYIPGPQTYN